MGYMRHHAIIVSSWDESLINHAHFMANEIGLPTTGITEEQTNGYRSFLVAPDGSKEGWTTSDNHDEMRSAFIQWLDSHRYDDGSTSIDWVEVQFGDDNYRTEIVDDSDKHLRQKAL